MRLSYRRVIAGALLSLALYFVPAFSQPKPDRLTAEDVFNVQFAADPQISPDGQKVVFVRRFSDIMADRRRSNLWIVSFDGSGLRPLTTGNQSDSSPLWSPDGTRIAYISDQDGKPQLYVRWMDTGQTAKLTNLEYAPSRISWSPDGKRIAFSTLVLGKGPQVAKLPAPPEGAKWAERPNAYDRLVYRFNGMGYLKPGYTQVFVIAAEGGAPRQITGGDFNNGGFTFFGSTPAWTPDGKCLILSANRHPNWELEPFDSEVYEFSVADGAVRALTDRRGPDNAPAVSPDGKLIAYTGNDEHYQGYQVDQLYVMSRDGSASRLLSAKLDRDVADPTWARDGKGIYFLYDDQGDTKLGYYSLDGEFRKVAEHIGSGGSSYSGGASFSLGPQSKVALTHTLPDEPGDIAVGTVGSTEVKVITDLNRELLAQKHPGKVEQFWFNSSVDQRKIQGWVIRPPDFDPAKKYPLILEIHGGPFANYGDRFDFDKQVLAAKGYVVLYVNPRGSTSYGEEFGNLIHHAYPGDDFYDLNSGVDAVIAMGSIDTNNLFVTGGSGGGVLTCWMIDRTTRFRAAASLYPVINWYSWTLTADIPIIGAKYWFPGPPWEYPDQYMKRSVISLVKNVKTPTLLMTGEADYRTPISEAEQYYTALKLLGVESLLVRVPGEPHGVSRRPSHEIAKVLYIAGWFDQHRKKQ